MHRIAAATLIIFACLGRIAEAAQDPWEDWNTPAEVRELILSAAARDRLGSDYNSLVWTGRLTQGQQAEYRSFLGELESRILAQCRKLAEQNPGKDFSDLPCPRGLAMSAPELAYVDTASEKTPEEAIAELESQLASGLGQYDDMLLQERQKIASRSPARSRAGSRGDREGDSGEGGKTGSRDASEGDGEWEEWEEYEDESQTDSQSGQPPSDRSESARSSVGSAQTKGYPPPEDIPDGSDDDVVARQIREAAQKEADPKLRKKLWEEYRRYKTAKR